MSKRVIWIVLDSAGCGQAPDADLFHDVGADTFGHILKTYPDANFTNMKSIGLDMIEGTSFRAENEHACTGAYGRARERSMGKDTTTGHFEMIGVITEKPMPTYPNGFPQELIDAYLKKIGVEGCYGNKVSSGIPIIEEYKDAHMKTGWPIIYTSADSVFQIAASEEKVGLDTLYAWCRAAREMLTGEHAVGRVIARPFILTENGFERTTNRRDYALTPPEDNVLVHLKDAGKTVAAVGKISDIFNGSGITQEVHTRGNADGMQKTLDYMDTVEEGLIFTNLVDFDMLYGHRRDVKGYKDALEAFDAWLPTLFAKMKDEDILLITADHGNDPTFTGTDHTREYVPVLLYGKPVKAGTNLGTLSSFADMGQTVEKYLKGKMNGETTSIGSSFLNQITV